MQSLASRWDTPELRATIYQFTVYFPGGVASVFLGIWLFENGIQAEQIGFINALPTLLLLILNVVVGRIADKADDWRTALIGLSIVSALVALPLFYVSEFWGILFVWALCASSNGLVPPVIDAATVRMTRRNGTDFGVIRAWATVGYVASAIIMGSALSTWGAEAFVYLYVAVVVARALLAFLLPRFRAPEPQLTVAAVTADQNAPSRLKDSLKLWFVLPLVAFALVNGGNAIMGGFASLLWHENGIGSYHIGPLLAVSAAAEAALMFGWRKFGGRFTARNMIMVSAIAGLVRFAIMAFSPPVWLLYVAQCLHALSFGLGYFGMVHFIANWTREENAAEAQGFSNMLTQAAAMVGLIVFGALMQPLGSFAFFYSVLACALAVVCVLISLKLKPPKSL
ncbi:MFS transporter [Devosia sp. WQ 349]|uniref:MFS transporter n=1 Tax=Devosia sp. WQ 349K1 TaxID=2800329 RepID=UPI00190837F5|nr:MFS transporter [Devosia sp. WQ 349K1]MBK1793687.1 MFS transporter [Devosia sp. WQ 349K1]